MSLIIRLLGGGEWITPNIVYVNENSNLYLQPYIKPLSPSDFPITLVEGDNGELGIKFYNYVKNGQYTNNDIVYLDWKGFLILHSDWGPTVDGNVSSNIFEVIDAYNPQGSPGHGAIELFEDGKLTIIY